MAWENHFSTATSLVVAIKDKFGLKTKLIEGIGGIFKVVLNDEVIFDNKFGYGEVPNKEDLLQQIEELSNNI